MKNLVIIGAGNLGKEAAWLVEDINKQKPKYLILGFLDDDAERLGTEFYGYRILGNTHSLSELKQKTPVSAVIAIQDGQARKQIVEQNQEFDDWETIIHPTAVVAPTAKIGKGSILFPQVTISVDTKLGDFGLYYIHSTICNDCTAGDYVSVMSGVQVSERVSIGSQSYLAAGCCIYPHKILGEKVFVSVGATVIKDCADQEKVKGRGNLFSIFK